MKAVVWRIAAVATIAGVAYAAYAYSKSPPAASLVRTVTVDSGTVNSFIRATGTVSSAHNVRVGATSVARVDEVFVEVGSKVKKGQRLVRLNEDELALQLVADELAVKELDTRRSQQQRELATLRQMHLAGGEPQEKVMQAEESLAMTEVQRSKATSKVAMTRLRLTQALIISPIDGIVTELGIQPGEVARTGEPLVTLSDSASQQIMARMEQDDVRDLRVGMAALVSIDSALGQSFEEKIVRIEPSVRREGNANYLPVWISLSQSTAWQPHPNQQVDVRVLVNSRPAAARLPLEALVTANGRSSVWAIEAGKLHAVPVSVGITGDKHVEVLSGLSPGQRVALLDGKALKEGAPVATVADTGNRAKP